MAVGMTLVLLVISFDVGGVVPHQNCAEAAFVVSLRI